MGKIENFKDLEVWQLAREICIDLEELFSITSLGGDILW